VADTAVEEDEEGDPVEIEEEGYGDRAGGGRARRGRLVDENDGEHSADDGASGTAFLHSSMGGLALDKPISAAIDPALWRAETERVAGQLGGALGWLGGAGSEWAQHLQQLKDYSRGSSKYDVELRPLSVAAARDTGDLVESIGRMRRTLDEGLARISAAEKALSTSTALSSLVGEYAGSRQVVHVARSSAACKGMC
jgi:hypothetical protein